MGENKSNVVKALHIEVNCEANTPEEITGGGPAMRGYDFFVNEDEDFNSLKTLIEAELKKNNQPLISIDNKGLSDIHDSRIFNKKRIRAAIKQDYRDLPK